MVLLEGADAGAESGSITDKVWSQGWGWKVEANSRAPHTNPGLVPRQHAAAVTGLLNRGGRVPSHLLHSRVPVPRGASGWQMPRSYRRAVSAAFQACGPERDPELAVTSAHMLPLWHFLEGGAHTTADPREAPWTLSAPHCLSSRLSGQHKNRLEGRQVCGQKHGGGGGGGQAGVPAHDRLCLGNPAGVSIGGSGSPAEPNTTSLLCNLCKMPQYPHL